MLYIIAMNSPESLPEHCTFVPPALSSLVIRQTQHTPEEKEDYLRAALNMYTGQLLQLLSAPLIDFPNVPDDPAK